jgi:hypothetical protein
VLAQHRVVRHAHRDVEVFPVGGAHLEDVILAFPQRA